VLIELSRPPNVPRGNRMESGNVFPSFHLFAHLNRHWKLIEVPRSTVPKTLHGRRDATTMAVSRLLDSRSARGDKRMPNSAAAAFPVITLSVWAVGQALGRE